MAYTTGTATDYLDLLTRLKDYLLNSTHGSGATGTILPVGERWIAEKDDSGAVANERHLYLRGPGSGGTDNIHVNIRALTNSVSWYNWDLRGVTSFDDGVSFDNQPGTSVLASDNGPTLSLSNSSFQYWIIANGRRFIVIANVSGNWVSAYLGFIIPYALPTEFPYPLLIAGNTYDTEQVGSTTSFQMGSCWYPPGTEPYPGTCSSLLREPGGEWLSFHSHSGSNASAAHINATWPYMFFYASAGFQLQVPGTEDSLILPIVLTSLRKSSNTYGEMEGVYWTSGTDRSSGDLITIATVEHLVVHNVYRQDPKYDFGCVALD